MGAPRLLSVAVSGFGGELQGGAGHVALGEVCLAGERLDAVAVPVPRREIHRAVHPGGIGAERLLDHAQRLDELGPVHVDQEPQAAHAVADGHLARRLDLAVGALQLLAGQSLLGEAMFDPALHDRQRRALPLEPAAELLHERVGERRVDLGHRRQRLEDVLRPLFRRRQQPVGPPVGEILVGPTPGDARGDTAKVLDQRQPQHDRHRPQLAERERGDGLVGRDEAAQVLRVHPAVDVRDQLQRDVVDAGEAGQGTRHQARELPAVRPRQVQLRHADLLLDQVVVVQQPFARGRDPQAPGLGCRHEVVGLDQDLFVLGQSRQQPVLAVPRVEAMLVCQRPGVPLQLLAAEQLRPQRDAVRRRRVQVSIPVAARGPQQSGSYPRHDGYGHALQP